MIESRISLLTLALVAVAAGASSGSPQWSAEISAREDRLEPDNVWIRYHDDGGVTPDPSDLSVREARLAATWTKARLHLGWSEEPDLTVHGTWSWVHPDHPWEEFRAEFANRALDLGIGYPWRPAPWLEAVPWLGVTRLEQRFRHDSTLWVSGRPESIRHVAVANRGWGAVLGVDVTATLFAPWLIGEGRLVSRWATGTTTITQLDEDGHGEQWVHQASARSSTSMWAAEVGLGVDLERLLLTAGWSRRDWTTDDGPGVIDGLYARLTVRF